MFGFGLCELEAEDVGSENGQRQRNAPRIHSDALSRKEPIEAGFARTLSGQTGDQNGNLKARRLSGHAGAAGSSGAVTVPVSGVAGGAGAPTPAIVPVLPSV